MDASNNDFEMTEMTEMSNQSRLQMPIQVEESEHLNPDAIVVDVPQDTQDDPSGSNNVENELSIIVEDGETKQKKWFR